MNVVMNLQVPQNAVNVACFLPGLAKDLSVRRPKCKCFLPGLSNLSAPLYKEQYVNIQMLSTHVLSCLVPLLIECVNGACENPVHLFDIHDASRDTCKRSLKEFAS